MFVTFNKNIFLTILLCIVFVCASDEQQSKTDNMCATIPSVLCVKDVLNNIARIAENINQTANDIEKRIFHKIDFDDNLNSSVNVGIELISANLPPHQYHTGFLHLSNIDKKYLGALLWEASYAMGFFYNSVEDLIKEGNIFAFTTDTWFQEIAYNLRNGIICPYRSILNVYSYEWPLMNEIDRIQFPRYKHRNSPSLVHEIHSIIIVRLLRQWTQRIQFVITNLDAKYA